MKTLLKLSIILLFFCSCNDNSDKTPPPPKEPCDFITLANLPVITHGFVAEKYDYVIVQTFEKGKNFNKVVEEFKISLAKVSDTLRIERTFSLPEKITTNFDLRFVFNDSLKYDITEMKTEWVPRWANKFIGYECSLVSYKINGVVDTSGSNIFVKEPDFNYPDL